MKNRPILNKHLDSITFQNYYYLKEELIQFCKNVGLPTSGEKAELTHRIAYFLDTGKILPASNIKRNKSTKLDIKESTKIEENFVCSEKHRAFFKSHIGNNFTFYVAFQEWLKNNTGKTYQEAIAAYYQILEQKKKEKTKIGCQFEYNRYIRDFFSNQPKKTLREAIICWKYKKRLPGHNRYEPTDLIALEESNY